MMTHVSVAGQSCLECSEMNASNDVQHYICFSLPDTLDPLQFAYRSNRSTDDAIGLATHTALTRQDNRNIYISESALYLLQLCIQHHHSPISLPPSLQNRGQQPCIWIFNSLTGRPQVVRTGKQLVPEQQPLSQCQQD